MHPWQAAQDSLFIFYSGDTYTHPCGNVNNENMYLGGEEQIGNQ